MKTLQILQASLALICAHLLISQAAGSVWPASTAVEQMSREPHASAVLSGPFTDWTVYHSESLDLPALAYGPPYRLTGPDPVSEAHDLVLQQARVSTAFELIQQTTIRDLTRAYYREIRNGLPVISGRLDLTLNHRSELMRWSLRAHDTWPTSAGHLFNIETAATYLKHDLEAIPWEINPDQSFKAWYPDHDGKILRPVYWLRLEGPEPHQRWEGIVDAENGEIIHQWSGIQTDVFTGTIQGPYWPEYNHEDSLIAPYASAFVFVNSNQVTTDADGRFSREAGQSADLITELRGLYVDVDNEDADDGQMTASLTAPFPPSFAWEWTTADAVRPELNLYYHTEFIHDWYKILDPAFDALDYPVPAVANVGNGYDNAYWNGYGTYYGSGGQYDNFAMYSDIIYHEYTHGVTDGIYPPGMLPYTGQSGALNEAWSDYFACTINGDPLMAECLYNGNCNSYFRNLEDDMVFPEDWFGEVHVDSPFISAPLWTIRARLGAAVADELAHFARYALAETFFDYLVAVLETDDDDGDISNGTPNAQVIYEAFGDHGIGPGLDPHFAINDLQYYADGNGGSAGDGDRFIEQGETAELVFDLVNDAELYPPPATNIQITVSTGDPDAVVANGSHTIDELGPGESSVMPAVQIALSAASEDRWVTVTIDVTADNDIHFIHEFLFSVGSPHLLVVKDDPESDVESYVTDAIRGQGKIYDEIELGTGDLLPAEHLPPYGLIIWLSGNARESTITTQDQYLLSQFLSEGSKVILSGQDIVDNLAGGAFLQNVLEVEVHDDSLRSNAVTATSEPLTPGEWYLTTGSEGAANQRSQSSFTPLGNSRSIGYYGRTGNGPTSVVEFAGGNGLLFGFGIEAISGMMPESAALEDLLEDIYIWADSLLPADPTPGMSSLPENWYLGPAYPNPFNATVSLPYAVPMERTSRLYIFDVLGRLVDSRDIVQSTGQLRWTHSGPSGLYFAQIRWNGGQTDPVRLLLLK